ncbi:ABC transporter permease [Clostridium cavendishii]|uniref:ABC transporter permease n=1 Tax=Clostridium cavendishii TaxID=349931 RepID=UPI0009333448|nr:FtsX-like permease family protein [Clostridium cavendishii]
MNIIMKFLWNNISEKKLRTALILFAIAIATSLCFASLGISKSFKNMVIGKYKAQFGNADIVITKKENSTSPFLRKENVDEISAKHKAKILNISSSYKKDKTYFNVNIIATNLTEIDKINKITYKEDSNSKNLESLEGNEIIISNKTATDLDLNINDNLNLKVNGENKKFKIVSIALDKGFFEEKPGVITIIGDLEGISKTLNMNDNITTVLLTKEDGKDTKKLKEDLALKYKDFAVSETIDKKVLEDAVNQFMIPFYVMLAVVVLMAVFIIYSSFKVIVLERMAVIGTFRSIGANKQMTDLILLLESLIYGVIGGVLGNLIGIPLLYLITDTANPYKQQGIKTVISIDLKYILITFVIGIMLSFFSALIPIVKIGKIEIKDIVLATFKSTDNDKIIRLFVGLLFIVAPYIYYINNRYIGSVIYTILCPFMILVGAAFIIPYIVKILSFILKEFIRLIAGNEGALAIHNMATTKNLIQNIIILGLGLGAVIVVHTSSYSVREMVENSFKGQDYKVSVNNINSRNGDKVIKSIESIKDIENYYENYYKNEVEVKNKNFRLGYLQGINTDKYTSFYKDFKILGDNGEVNKIDTLNKLENERTIVLSDLFKNKYKYKIGDIINIKLKDSFVDYKVVGFIKSEISSNQRVCLISQKFFIEDVEQSQPNHIYIKGVGSEENLKNEVTDQLNELNVVVTTKAEEEKVNISKNADLMNTLQSFSTMALIIGAFGMINNLMVSFLERKRELAVLASIGMSKYQRGKMILIEGVFAGLVGGVFGVIIGYCLSIFVPEITLGLDTYLNIKIPINQILILGMVGALLMIISSLVPLIKAKNIAIVQEIKYE